jgi:large subunit ribosomal protein L21
MYAVIETGGKQYRVQEGDVITVEKLKVLAGESVAFDRVLVLADGETVQVGTPTIESAKVLGTVVENGKGEKVIIFKYKRKKDYRKKQGHRQPYTMIKIESLSADGKPTPKKAEEKPVIAEAAAKTAVNTEVSAEAKKPAAKKTPAEKAPAEKKPSARKAAADGEAAEKKPAEKKAVKTEEAEAAE